MRPTEPASAGADEPRVWQSRTAPTCGSPAAPRDSPSSEAPSRWSVVSLPQWVVHHDERWFDAPLEFRPERWATWDGPEYAYFPFSGGPRHCIGMRFARTELRLLVATLARRFRVESLTDAPLDLVATANAVPDGPVGVRLHER
ncbi:cytochrome P450 [Halomarina litorea]|uniref:cytochrome P450 n=1 Tax=Halomarina litorea TaxID=2961595 RepID=UPI0020C5867F|nr:cytochrome P450 [Halomarina sp. BCD28]